jgi:hypothetical protein
MSPLLPTPLSPRSDRVSDCHCQSVGERGCLLFASDPGRRSRVTAVTRSLALGYFMWPLQGHRPLSVRHSNTPYMGHDQHKKEGRGS